MGIAPGSPEEMAQVHHALENPVRRRILVLITKGLFTATEISDVRMLDYHLHRLEMAGLIEVLEGRVSLTESGRAYGELLARMDRADG